jgi:L-rhamnose isomerase/sugar isomerase
MRVGAVNPNLFQEEDYVLGSVCHPDAAVRRKATEHLIECVEIGRELGSDVLSLWFADGTNYAGQDSFVERRRRMREGLTEAYEAMPENMRMLLEYKPFEPAFYHTDLPDWGAALAMCQRLGDKAEVLVDLGHHLQGTNIEHIVALLLDEGRLGGFHFNNRKYADDDLIVGSNNPFELFLIYTELVEAEESGARIDYMIDQAHNVLGGHRVLLDAYNTDVRPLCAKVREDLGGSAEPVVAFRASGYLERAMVEREEGAQAGWG